MSHLPKHQLLIWHNTAAALTSHLPKPQQLQIYPLYRILLCVNTCTLRLGTENVPGESPPPPHPTSPPLCDNSWWKVLFADFFIDFLTTFFFAQFVCKGLRCATAWFSVPPAHHMPQLSLIPHPPPHPTHPVWCCHSLVMWYNLLLDREEEAGRW